MEIQNILKEEITVAQVLDNLKKREKTSSPMNVTERASIINKFFSNMSLKTVALAKEALEGILLLPGSADKHFVGNPPKWLENPFDDAEYTFELNRMQHWKTMLEAYSLTNDERFAKKVIEECYDWWNVCPCPYDGEDEYNGVGPWRILEVGIRGFIVWPVIIEHLIQTNLVNEDFFEKLLLSVWEHCRILYHFSPLYWPKADHNHYLMENLGLLAISSIIPEFKDSHVWQEHALRELNRCIDNQVTTEGGQIEGSPSYHNACVFWFSLTLSFGKKYGFEVSKHYIDKLKQMFEYSVYSTRPCSGNTPWGDSHTYVETMTLAAVSCYIAFDDILYLQYACHFYSSDAVMWDLRRNIWQVTNISKLHTDLEEIQNTEFHTTLDTMTWQKDLKQVFMRTSWDNDALSLIFSCRSPIQNLHAHMDVGGFDFCAYGSPLVCDPGVFTYKHDENRRYYKSSKSHNVLTINNEEPWEYRGAWDYGPQKLGIILNAEHTKRMMYAISWHENYKPAIAQRAIAIVDNQFVVIMDKVTGLKKSDSIQIRFHLNTRDIRIKDNDIFTTSDKSNVAIYHFSNAKLTVLDGRISDYNDVEHPSKMVCYECEQVGAPTFIALSILVPMKSNEEPKSLQLDEFSSNKGSIQAKFSALDKRYTIRWENNTLIFE